MSTSGNLSTSARRTSERRRLKLLKNKDEFKVVNPYRHHAPANPLPSQLTTQLNKIDYLSHSAISLLAFQQQGEHNPELLFQMAEAQRAQEEKFAMMFGQE